MTNLIDMGDREYFAWFAKRPGMFIGRTTLCGVTAFMEGYDQAARRCGGRGLDGWREWLMTNHQVASNLVWESQILQIALPDSVNRRDLTAEQEAQVLEVLFDLLDKFLAERENAEPMS